MNACVGRVRQVGAVLMGLLTLIMVGCGTSSAVSREPHESAASASDEMPEPMSSGEILYVIQTINKGEIEQAELALQHSQNSQVAQVAHLILEDHVASNQHVDAIADALDASYEPSTLSKGIQFQARAFREDIARLAEEEFNQAYLQKQVELHEVALDVVRTQLLPSTDEPKVRDFLTDYLYLLEMHRRSAKESLREVL